MNWPISWFDVKEGLEKIEEGGTLAAIPVFDLSEMGLAPISCDSNDGSTLVTDTTEIIAAMDKGPVWFKFQAIVPDSDTPRDIRALLTPYLLKDNGVDAWCCHFVLLNAMIGFRVTDENILGVWRSSNPE